MTKDKVLKIIEYISLSAAIILSVVFGVLDACGLKVYYLLGWLIGCLATFFLTFGIRESKKDKITSYTISQLDNTKVILKDIDEIDEYIAERIEQAELSVYDFCWWDFYPIEHCIHRHQPTAEKLGKAIDKAISTYCKKGGGRIYKEIFSLHTNSNKKKLLEHAKNTENYQCAHYDTSVHKFPKLQFVIIDEKELIFASRYYPTHCIIKDKNIIDIMINYFDQAWTLATKIIDDDHMDTEFLKSIRQTIQKK